MNKILLRQSSIMPLHRFAASRLRGVCVSSVPGGVGVMAEVCASDGKPMGLHLLGVTYKLIATGTMETLETYTLRSREAAKRRSGVCSIDQPT